MSDLELHQQEYQTRVKYFKTDYRGNMNVPTEANFHPNLFKGTQEEFEDICRKYLDGKEDEFKIIGIHTFDTYEDYLKTYKNLH
jgi:hypothetical protein